MVEVNAQDLFWKQLREHFESYGLTMVIFTLSSSLLIGYFLHYLMNVQPMNERLKLDKKEQAEETEKDGMSADNASIADLAEKEQKQVGVVKGMINKEVLRSFRRKPPPQPPINKLPDFIAEKGPLFEDCLQKIVSSDAEDYGNLVVVQNSGKKRSQSLQENCSLSERDLLHTLGKLHGKLATAQLRARTKRMQADMTAEEKDDEARTKAKQLESIMNLMMQNKEKFGMDSEDDIKEQLNMYNF